MKKNKRVALLSLTLAITFLSASFSVSAEDYKKYGTVTLARGGTSKAVVSDYVDTYTGKWWSYCYSVSFVGIPAGIWNQNKIYVRPRTASGASPVADIREYTCYTGGYRDYYEGYGGANLTYILYASMPSGLPNSGVTASFEFASY